MNTLLNVIFAFIIGFMACYIYLYKRKDDKKEDVKTDNLNDKKEIKHSKHPNYPITRQMRKYFDPLSREEIIRNERIKKTTKTKADKIEDKDKIILVKIDDDYYYFSSMHYAAALFQTQANTLQAKITNNEEILTSDGKKIKIYTILKDKIDNNLINTFIPTKKDKNIYTKVIIDNSHSDTSSKYKLLFNGKLYYCNTYAEMSSITNKSTIHIMNILKNKINDDKIKVYLNER